MDGSEGEREEVGLRGETGGGFFGFWWWERISPLLYSLSLSPPSLPLRMCVMIWTDGRM
jgi:hypothetical protein